MQSHFIETTAVDSHQDESVDDYMDLVLKNDFTEGFVTTCWVCT